MKKDSISDFASSGYPRRVIAGSCSSPQGGGSSTVFLPPANSALSETGESIRHQTLPTQDTATCSIEFIVKAQSIGSCSHDFPTPIDPNVSSQHF
ncbi:hypothetical protein V2G26_016631 [Clonostachys chloroleuca]